MFLSDTRNHEEAETLDTLVCTNAQLIEEAFPNRFQYDYSAELLQKKAMITIRKHQRSQLLTSIDYSEQIKALQLIHNIDDLSIPTSVAEARALFSQAIHDVKLAQKEHITLRKTFLDDMIADLHKENTTVNKERIKALKTIKSTEQVIRAFCNIKFRRPGGLRQQINRIQVPTDINMTDFRQ